MSVKSMSIRSIGLTLIYLLVLGFSMTFLSGCSNSPSKVGVVDKGQNPPVVNGSQNTQPIQAVIPDTANVSVDDLDAAIKANQGWQLVDIREAREFATGHIKMAINRPFGVLENNLAQISKDKDIVLIDLNGTRAQAAWHVLVEKGYDQNKVKVLTGGMLQWRGIVSAAGSGNSGDANNSSEGADAPPEAKPEVQEMVGGC